MLHITLTTDQQTQLTHLLHQSLNHRVRQRCQAVLLSHKGYKRTQIADLFAVKVDTVTAWFRRWQQNQTLNQLADAPRSGRKTKLQLEQKKT